jgi:hypothetical protein
MKLTKCHAGDGVDPSKFFRRQNTVFLRVKSESWHRVVAVRSCMSTSGIIFPEANKRTSCRETRDVDGAEDRVPGKAKACLAPSLPPSPDDRQYGAYSRPLPDTPRQTRLSNRPLYVF